MLIYQIKKGEGNTMDESTAIQDFSAKFGQLNEQNQKYIVAIQQALLYAQEAESSEETKKEEEEQ